MSADRDALVRGLIGLDLPTERIEILLAAYAPILGEIEKLRALDLADIHPAVIFDPVLPEPPEGDAP